MGNKIKNPDPLIEIRQFISDKITLNDAICIRKSFLLFQ